MHSARTSLAITLSVWKALFLRESLSCLFSARAAWFWLLAERAPLGTSDARRNVD
jgi:capsular polysaccharide transport system permease protein